MLDAYGDRHCPTIPETISILSCTFQELYPHKDDVFIRNIVTYHVSNKVMQDSYSLWTTFVIPELKKSISTDLEHTKDPMKNDD